MMKQFEIGRSYPPNDRAYDPIVVIRRTPQFIVGRIGLDVCRMKIWINEDGVECLTDSHVPERWREAFTYRADDPVD